MQQTATEVDCTEYMDRPELWSSTTIGLDENGHVNSSIHIFDSENGIDVTATVCSYDYERHGERRENHVPRVVVTDPDGTIRQEPHAHDSRDVRKAIERAIQTAEWAYEEYR
jgi:hypothetical protein